MFARSHKVCTWEQVFHFEDLMKASTRAILVETSPSKTKKCADAEGERGIKNCEFFFHFQDMALNISCLQNWALLVWRKGSIKVGRKPNKIPSTVLKTRYSLTFVPSLGDFQLFVLEINSREGTKNMVWETANFLYSFVQKTNATEQFSPVDPFEIKAGPPWFEFLVTFNFFAPWYRRSREASSVKRA